jgi:hypothetical protein
MGKAEKPSRQVNARIERTLHDEADEIRRSEPYEPTWTQLFESLLREWVTRKRAERGAGGKSKGKP